MQAVVMPGASLVVSWPALYTTGMLLYARVAWFNFATYLAYPFEMLAAFVKPFISLGFTLLFWGVVAASSQGKIDFRHIVAYFMVATAISNMLLLGGLRLGSVIARSIKNGELNYPLIRPLNVPMFYLASRVGSLGMTYVVSAIFLVSGLLLAPPTGWLSVLSFLLFLAPALAIAYGMNMFVAVIGFYSTETDSIRNVINHFLNVFAGTLIPLSLFPGVFRTIITLLPFASAVYGPTQALHTASWSSTTTLNLVVAYVWAVVFVAAANAMWRRSLRVYEAIGM